MLDSLISPNDNLLYLKLDIEGAEPAALQEGAGAILSAVRYIYIEVSVVPAGTDVGVWAAVSGIALIAPAWIAELVAYYIYDDTTLGTRWQENSYFQLLIFFSLALGVACYNELLPVFQRAGKGRGAQEKRAEAGEEQTQLLNAASR